MIGQDFDLPMQITASPAQASPAIRSLEEELQEAIQRVQVCVFGFVCCLHFNNYLEYATIDVLSAVLQQ